MKISRQNKKTHLRTKVITKIENISPDQWNKIFPNVPENYYFLKTLDESKFDQFSFSYILIYNGQQLIGCAPCFTLNYSLDTSINGPLRQITNGLKKVFPNIFTIKALVCGIPMGQGQIGIKDDSNQIFQSLLQRMESLASKTHCQVIAFKDFDQSYDTLFQPLFDDGFIKIDSLPMTRMDLNFKDFDDYLASLNSNARYNLKKKIKKASSANIETSLVNSLDAQTLNEVYALYLQIVETHDMGFEIVPKEFFSLMSKNMPQNTKFFLWRIKGQLVAFTFCLVSNNLLLDYYIGFDYAKALEYHLFFIKFQDILNWCLSNNIKVYEMGSTGYDGKRRLNFKLAPVYLYVKMRFKPLRPFFKILCNFLKFENFDPELKRWQQSTK